MEVSNHIQIMFFQYNFAWVIKMPYVFGGSNCTFLLLIRFANGVICGTIQHVTKQLAET